MKSKGWPFLLIFVLALTACNGSKRPTPVNSTPVPFNLLLMATDEVKLKRESWSDYHLTAFGAELERGDQIWPSDHAEVVVLCDNLTLWHVPAGVPSGLSNGCPQAKESYLNRNGKKIGNTRAARDPFIPYIITPRITNLLTQHPRLRWNEVLGASSYTVRIQGVEWEAEVEGTDLIYPNMPPLEPGRAYLLTVEADTGRSSDEDESEGLGFVLLSEEEAKSVQAVAQKLDALTHLPDQAQTLARAHLYASHDLNLMAEAINTLDPLAQEGSQRAAIYRFLAKLYQQSGLPLLAERHYVKAITLAEEANDIEGRTAAQAALGEIYLSLGNKEEAITWFSLAKEGYDTLGDTERASQLMSRLMGLQP